MAAASPTPMPAMSSNYRLYRAHSTKYVRRDSPPVNTSTNGNATAIHRPIRPQVDSTDSDDDLQPPPMLSALGRSVLEQSTEAPASPSSTSKPVRFRLVRKDTKNGSAHNTPAKDTTTPAPSVRIRRVGLQGAPVRRGKRTPQSDEGHGSNFDHEHEQESQEREEQPPSQDQENLPVSVPRPKSTAIASDVMVKPDPGSVLKSHAKEKPLPTRERPEKVPLAQVSANTPRRPAPPPPPKMSVLEAATKAAGASTTRKKTSRRPPIHCQWQDFPCIRTMWKRWQC